MKRILAAILAVVFSFGIVAATSDTADAKANGLRSTKTVGHANCL